MAPPGHFKLQSVERFDVARAPSGLILHPAAEMLIVQSGNAHNLPLTATIMSAVSIGFLKSGSMPSC
jgi:hypothetical protein